MRNRTPRDMGYASLRSQIKGAGPKIAAIKHWDQAGYMRRYRARAGNRQLSMQLRIDAAAALIYLKMQWGFRSNAEAVNTALVYLSRQTRSGLKEINLGELPAPADRRGA